VADRRRSTGAQAEQLAAEHLALAGVQLIARNVRVRYRELGVAGELDIVGRENDTLVIAEVKARRAGSTRGPERAALAVGRHKQLRIRRLTRAWLASDPALPWFSAIRFDVIGVELDQVGSLVELDWIRGAF
jgi:putative endonuclease